MKILIELLIIGLIGSEWDEKRKKNKTKKRLYHFMEGMTYLITALLSLLLVSRFGEVIYLYTVLAGICGICCFLTAINCNLRIMFSYTLIYGFIILIIAPHFRNHMIIFSIIDLVLISAIITVIKESVYNMIHGIDPDAIEEEKEARRKLFRGIKLVWKLFKIW